MKLPADRHNAECILICSFRYALGRMTYMPTVIAEWIYKLHADEELSKNARSIIVREIREAERLGNLGMPFDAAMWLELADTISNDA